MMKTLRSLKPRVLNELTPEQRSAYGAPLRKAEKRLALARRNQIMAERKAVATFAEYAERSEECFELWLEAAGAIEPTGYDATDRRRLAMRSKKSEAVTA
jgi:hypothetical protein